MKITTKDQVDEALYALLEHYKKITNKRCYKVTIELAHSKIATRFHLKQKDAPVLVSLTNLRGEEI